MEIFSCAAAFLLSKQDCIGDVRLMAELLFFRPHITFFKVHSHL